MSSARRWAPTPSLPGISLLQVLALMLIGGCAGGLHSDAHPVQVYVIRYTGLPQQPAARSARAALSVSRPRAGPGLDSDHIVLVQADHRMSYFAGSRWPAALPPLLEPLVVDGLRASGRWTTVQDSSSPFATDLILQITIDRFEADYTRDPGRPEIHVELDCAVGHRLGREVDAGFRVAGSAVAAANRLSEVIAAFERATNEALQALAIQAPQSPGSPQ